MSAKESKPVVMKLAAVALGALLAVGGLAPATAVAQPAAAQPAVASSLAPIASVSAVQVAAAKKVTQVKTTANLNMRSKSNTKAKVLLTIPRGKSLAVKSTAGNGWYRVTYKNKTGWISNSYAKVTKSINTKTKKAAPKKQTPKKSTNSKVNLWLKPTASLNIRKGAGTNYGVVRKISKGHPVAASQRAANGWYKVTHKGKTGWVSNKYVTTCSKGCEIDNGAYTTNRAGLSDRYFTKSNGADLYASTKGKVWAGDIPKNSIVYRDLKWEKKAGQVSGWYYVRTQGLAGWMKSSALKRSSNAATSNTKKVSKAKVLKRANGKLPESMLVAIPWDAEKTLIAAPALKQLTSLNTAFKKKFGKNLDIDLAYRTLATQQYLYKELGSYIAAKPGTSNHGWGMAIDVPETYNYSFKGKYYKWLKANSKKYNWVHRSNLEEFRANGSKNPYAEAWHFEYVGK